MPHADERAAMLLITRMLRAIVKGASTIQERQFFTRGAKDGLAARGGFWSLTSL